MIYFNLTTVTYFFALELNISFSLHKGVGEIRNELNKRTKETHVFALCLLCDNALQISVV